MEKKPTWNCPVCYAKIAFSTVVVDGLFTEILASPRSQDTTEVQFDDVNGTIEWKPIIKEQEVNLCTDSPVRVTHEDATPRKRKRTDEFELVDLADSSSEDESDDLSWTASCKRLTTDFDNSVCYLSSDDEDGSRPLPSSSDSRPLDFTAETTQDDGSCNCDCPAPRLCPNHLE